MGYEQTLTAGYQYQRYENLLGHYNRPMSFHTAYQHIRYYDLKIYGENGQTKQYHNSLISLCQSLPLKYCHDPFQTQQSQSDQKQSENWNLS